MLAAGKGLNAARVHATGPLDSWSLRDRNSPVDLPFFVPLQCNSMAPSIYRLIAGIFVLALSGSTIGFYLVHEAWDKIAPPTFACFMGCLMLGIELFLRARRSQSSANMDDGIQES